MINSLSSNPKQLCSLKKKNKKLMRSKNWKLKNKHLKEQCRRKKTSMQGQKEANT